VANLPAQTILDHVRRTIGTAEFGALGDDELLRYAFLSRDSEAQTAFAVLVQRHSTLVYRTCFATLRDAHDAEDAFQATFLVLARKGKSLRARKCLGPWLYEVARRVAAHARAAADRRARHERHAAAVEGQTVPSHDREHLTMLHDALGRLPARFRLPIVLCDLEELSYRDAAERLGWSVPTIRNRLARGRRRLQTALRRLGLDSATAMSAYGTIPAAPRLLLTATAQSTAQFAMGTAAGTIPVSILALTNQGMHNMLLIKLQTAGLAFVASAALIAGAYGLSGQAPNDKPKANASAANASNVKSAATPTPASSLVQTATLIAKLTGPATIEKPIDGAILKDVLEFLHEQCDVRFIIDIQAFERIGKKTVEDEQVRLPKMTGVTLDTILRHVLAQVNGAVMVRNNHLEVISRDQAVLESRNGVLISFPEDVQPLVNVACEERPLEKILTDLSRQSGRNVILDSRVKDRDRLTVTVTLLNAPLDTAARLIAEMVNLKTVSIDNVVFVTTRENAAELIAEEKSLLDRRKAAAIDRAAPLQPKP
jgi:RNA polymerase sigma factor (sigma-70 family)